MLKPRDIVVVAVSGGSDSVGLLKLLTELNDFKLNLIVAHVNHNLRGEESLRDADFVRELSKKLNLELEVTEVNTEKFKKKYKLSLEDAARKLRYNFLFEVKKKHFAEKIATAHTFEDQAETVLIRFLRGSGATGLSGISPASEFLIRPLINISRSEIREYLKSKKISWMEDSTNDSMDFLRNRVRKELIPILKKEYNPNIYETLVRSSQIFKIEMDFIRKKVDVEFNKVVSKRPIGFVGVIKRFLKLDKAVRLGVLRKCIEELEGNIQGISSIHFQSIDEFLSSDTVSGQISLPGQLYFAKSYNFFCLTHSDLADVSYSYLIEGEGKFNFSSNLSFEIEYTGSRSFWGDENVGHFSAKALKFPLRVRNVKPGDRFIPLGMKGFKKVKDYLIDKKIPRFLRKSIPIFETEDRRIVWIGGYRIDEKFKVKKNEKRFLRIKILKPNLSFIKDFQDA